MNCLDCTHYIKDSVNATGLGACKKYNDYKERTTNLTKLMSARVACGNRYDSDVFWPGNGRECSKFEAATG